MNSRTTPPRIYADFHNADPQGRVRLNCVGTQEDLSRLGIQLREGLLLDLYCDDADDRGNPDDLQVHGVVRYSPQESFWVAEIDWSSVKHVSELGAANGNGATVEDGVSAPQGA